MKKKTFGCMVCWVALLLLAVSNGVLAQSPTEFNGVIDAYTPQSGSTGPYEIHGPWSLQLSTPPVTGSFTAALDMELSDGWVLTENHGDFDPKARGAHTHHVTLVGAYVTPTPNGFQLTGMATITLNGNPAPVSPSPLVISVTGGRDVRFSNITLTFGSPGSKHFGTEALNGVIQKTK